MRHFYNKFQVNAPIQRVAEFHSSTMALKQLTPPPMFVRLNHIEPLGEGSRSDFTLWFGPIPIHWIAVHSDVHPQKGFTDTQLEGPFKTWVHRHSFKPVADNFTEIIDEVKGLPSDHLFWGLVSRFMWLTLPILFSYRAWQTQKAVEG
jgi:ligand-binding SRPBCC domain-containing protein